MPALVMIRNNYSMADVNRVISYVTRSGIVGGYAVDPEHAGFQMNLVKTVFHKIEGQTLKHFIISLSTGEMCYTGIDDLLEMGFECGKLLGEYQLVYGVHADSKCLHLHCVMNTVSFLDGHKYSGGDVGFLPIREMLRTRFPRSPVYFMWSDPYSTVNRFREEADEFLCCEE